MASELLPALGDIRPHGHLKLGRFTQHFVDVLDLEQTPLEFFESKYPNDAREDQRKYLGRFGVSGQMQVRKMKELSDGQLSRVVFAKLGRDVPHILLLDEPTNHLDVSYIDLFLIECATPLSTHTQHVWQLYQMESIDALAKAVNEFEGGLILVSHDMRLISQVANEIWMCDNKTITPYKGDIQSFKMDMRAQMGIEGVQKVVLRGDASKKEAEHDDKRTKDVKKAVSTPNPPALASPPKTTAKIDDDAITATTAASVSSVASNDDAPKRYIPPHLRKKMQEESS
jgi:ATP-binding cassette subfamily F protein 2